MTEEAKEEPKMIEVTEANALVNDIARKVHALIVAELGGVHPKQQFLLMCRVVTFVFNHHFRMVINVAQDSIHKQEQEAP